MTAQELRELRERLGLTQVELAERIGFGCDHSRVSRWERGKRRIPAYWIPHIRRAIETAEAGQAAPNAATLAG